MNNSLARLEVPFSPIPFLTRNRGILGYELLVYNLSERELDLQSVKVTSADWGYSLQNLEGAVLTGNTAYFTPEYKRAAQQAFLPGSLACVYLWLELEPDKPIPAELLHEVEISEKEGDETFTFCGTFSVQQQNPVTIQPPLRGRHWLAGNGPDNKTGHRRTILPVRGQPDIAQRFAVDWVQFGPDGRPFHDDMKENSNWYGYGTDLLAVADGTILEARDGVPENVPFSGKMAIEITLDSAPGNYILLDMGGEHYALYAHMLPGSLLVKPGDRVKAGQVLGKMGNSGNSDAPHLHFHLGNHALPLGMQGLPYHFDSFELVGTVEDADALLEQGLAWTPGPGEPLIRRDQSFLSSDVLNL
jgi:murein DD-endopeptidase